MKHLLLLPGLLAVSGSLLAQTVTLSANTFYRGDAPGTYTITCPVGTSAGVSVLTKIADVPLLDPASVQYGIGVTFPWPAASSATPTLTGTLPQSSTQTVMGGNLVYNAGVLAGTAFCNNAVATLTTATAFTLTLNGITRDEIAPLRDRLTWALKASSVKMPQLSTAEQAALPPQQAGNVVFNTDQKTLAVHTGSSWQYLGGAAPDVSQFTYEAGFLFDATWTVPSGVTRIMAEVWAGGAGERFYTNTAGTISAMGGAGGGYSRGQMTVVPGESLTLTVGAGGQRGSRTYNTAARAGGNSRIEASGQRYVLTYGGEFAAGIPTTNGFGFGGGTGSDLIASYGQRSATDYMLIIKCGNGGTAFGAQPGGIGTQFIATAAGSVFYTPFDNNASLQGSIPGGGGGAGYDTGGGGGGGMIIIHW